MSELLPKLTEIHVDPFDLLLDPNNPRYFSDERELVHDKEIGLAATQAKAASRMKRYNISELQSSMLENGYVPTDAIFVTLHSESGKYLVREGNRRVTAIKGLLNEAEEPKCKPELVSQLSRVSVLLVESNGDEKFIAKQISYLLGVRHHGSLKKWTPFARAQNALKHYLDIAGQNEDSFRWDESLGSTIAKSLSVSTPEILDSFKVYRAMQQVDAQPSVKAAGGVSAKSFSLFQNMLAPGRKALRGYIPQDPKTFLFPDNKTFEKIDRLCHFSSKDRKDAPINRPQEWASFNSILADDDNAKKLENIVLVEDEKIKPSVIWATRSAELKRLDWSKWLHRVELNLMPVNAGQMLQQRGTDEYKRAVDALSRVDTLVKQLKDISNIKN